MLIVRNARNVHLSFADPEAGSIFLAPRGFRGDTVHVTAEPWRAILSAPLKRGDIELLTEQVDNDGPLPDLSLMRREQALAFQTIVFGGPEEEQEAFDLIQMVAIRDAGGVEEVDRAYMLKDFSNLLKACFTALSVVKRTPTQERRFKAIKRRLARINNGELQPE